MIEYVILLFEIVEMSVKSRLARRNQCCELVMPVPVSAAGMHTIAPPRPFYRPYPQLYPPGYPTSHSSAYPPQPHYPSQPHYPPQPHYPSMYQNQPSLLQNSLPQNLSQQSIIPISRQEDDKDYHRPPSYQIVEYSKNANLLSGNIVINTTDSIPKGYLRCDGSDISRRMYPDLFKAIGTYYGVGDKQTTFSLPNLQDDNNTTHYLIKI